MILVVPQIIKNHYRIFVLAFLIGLVCSVPQYLEKKTSPNFQGIYIDVVKDQGFYQIRTRDVIDGHPYLTNPYLYEHKEGAPMQFWIPEVILAIPMMIFGVSVPVGFIIWTFFLTALLALLSYGVVYTITRSKNWSLLIAAALHIGLYGAKFIRLPPHGFNFVFWLATLLFLLLFITRGKTRYAVGSAVFFGLMFNMYPYHWTYYVVVFGIFLALSFILRVKDFPYKKYIAIIGGALVIGIPYFVSMWQSVRLVSYDESLARLGLIHSHFPSGLDSVAVAGLVTLLLLVAYWRKVITINHLSVFLFSGVLAAAIAVNHHVITGKNVEFSSHYVLGNMFWCVFAATYVIHEYFKTRTVGIRKGMVIVGGILLIAVSFKGAAALIRQQVEFRPASVYMQNYAPVFAWLNENTEKDEVIFANEEISALSLIYTHVNVFFAPGSTLSFMTNAEVENRFIISKYFESFTDEFVLNKQRHIFGSHHLNEYGHNLSKNKLRKLFGIEPVAYTFVPEAEIKRIQAQASTTRQNSFESLLKSYRSDYLVWDSNKDPHWKVEGQPYLRPVYRANGFVIYEIL
jgi:hypothetical protein